MPAVDSFMANPFFGKLPEKNRAVPYLLLQKFVGSLRSTGKVAFQPLVRASDNSISLVMFTTL